MMIYLIIGFVIVFAIVQVGIKHYGWEVNSYNPWEKFVVFMRSVGIAVIWPIWLVVCLIACVKDIKNK